MMRCAECGEVIAKGTPWRTVMEGRNEIRFHPSCWRARVATWLDRPAKVRPVEARQA